MPQNGDILRILLLIIGPFSSCVLTADGRRDVVPSLEEVGGEAPGGLLVVARVSTVVVVSKSGSRVPALGRRWLRGAGSIRQVIYFSRVTSHALLLTRYFSRM